MNFLNHLSVKARITTLFIFFLFIFALFGLFTIQRTQILGDLTRTLHDHPLQVSTAALEAESGVVKMHRGMKDLAMAQSQMAITTAIQTVQTEEKNVYRNLDTVKRLILGVEGKKLVRETIESFSGWKPIRIEFEELVLQGNKEGAARITREKGADYAVKLERKMNELSEYAHDKADSFMVSADETLQQIKTMIWWAIGLGAIVCLFAAFMVINSITRSLGLLQDKMSQITHSGEMSQIELAGKNEITELAYHFNILISTIKDQLWLRNNIEEINRELGGDISFAELTDKCISIISRGIDACAGAFYLYDKESRTCNLTSSFAFVERNYLASNFAAGEGIIGQVAIEKKPILLKNISRSDACANSGTVSEPPICIYAVPISYKHELLAILEVASFEPINTQKKQFIDEAAGAVSSLLNTAIQSKEIKALFAASQQANEELQAKTNEINAQNDELGAVNNELQAQSQEMEAQRDELQAQTTELEARRIQVEAADKLKSEFLSNMSHELRTPLNSIMSLSQLMISRGVDKDPAKAVEYLKVIDRNGRQLLNLINDILDLTKIESGRMDIFPTKFEAKRIIDGVLETVTPLAQKKNIQFETRIDQVPLLFSDEDKVYQILLNFCSNAIKFTEKGIVNIAVNATGGMVSFMVKDTGIGISADDLGTIFDQFRQVDGSFTRAQEGTGLGLAISRKLAILLGGNITVESTPGTGSTFTLTLPISVSGAELPLETSAALPAPTAVSGHHPVALTVLVIDDEEEARNTLSTYLTEGGYNVLLAKSGKEGLEMAKALQPDVISLDLLMPTMDGWEVLRHLKSAPETVAIPIIINSVSKDKDTAWALGAAGYVLKPVNNQLLLEEIQRVSGKKPAKRLLIADDDLGVQEFLKDFLGTKGFIVETVGNGKEALAMVETSPPHLLILDLLMPDMDGFSVLEQLRLNPKTLDLPVIILTSKDLTKDDLQRLTSAVKTISKNKLNKEAFLHQIETALTRQQERSTPDLPLTNQILVVEDNEIASQQIVTALQENGFEVAVAKDGVEGLAHVMRSIPAGIILDLMMPRVDGFQVLEQIRSWPETAKIPVLILTAKEISASERALLTNNNIQQLIQKGTADRDQLVASVRRLVDAPRNQPKKLAPKTAQSRIGTILLVEDNADNRLTITAIIEEEGCEILITENGEQGVLMAAEKMPDLILMDIQLPVMSGIDAIKIIKKNPTTRAIPIIAITARAMKGDRENILGAGADDYISKPINPVELQEKVRKWMGII